jgi:hypothetical protein
VTQTAAYDETPGVTAAAVMPDEATGGAAVGISRVTA